MQLKFGFTDHFICIHSTESCVEIFYVWTTWFLYWKQLEITWKSIMWIVRKITARMESYSILLMHKALFKQWLFFKKTGLLCIIPLLLSISCSTWFTCQNMNIEIIILDVVQSCFLFFVKVFLKFKKDSVFFITSQNKRYKKWQNVDQRKITARMLSCSIFLYV